MSTTAGWWGREGSIRGGNDAVDDDDDEEYWKLQKEIKGV